MYNVEELLEDKRHFYHVTKDLFRIIDTEDSGIITEQQLLIILKSLADDFGYQRPNIDDTEKICDLLIPDHKGFITLAHFRRIVQKIFKAVYENRVQQEAHLKSIADYKEMYE